MTPLADIQIYDNYVKMDYADQQGARYVKNVSYDDFKSIFSEVKVTTPIFPVWVSLYKEHGDDVKIMTTRTYDRLEVKKASSDIRTFHIPFISFLWVFKRQDNNLLRRYTERVYFSYKAPSEETKFYKPNFPNIYSDLRICWGGNDDPGHDVTDMATLSYWMDLWQYSDFNNDMVSMESLDEANGKVYEGEEDWSQAPFVANAEPLVGKELREIDFS